MNWYFFFRVSYGMVYFFLVVKILLLLGFVFECISYFYFIDFKKIGCILKSVLFLCGFVVFFLVFWMIDRKIFLLLVLL